jgi:hypothetical protein
MAQPSCAETKYFLIDVDTQEEKELAKVSKSLEEIGVQTLDVGITPNGVHVITEPFNPNLFKLDHEIKKDAQLLISW